MQNILLALCQKFNVNPHKPFVDEWQEALNASPGLMDDFIEAKRSSELEQMGVNKEEKAALDNIVSGNMDMHQRMAQAQDAQRAVVQGSPADQDPDPLVFPGQRVRSAFCSSASRSWAHALTWEELTLVPQSFSTMAETLRVETFWTYISVRASLRACSERRPFSRALG